MQRHGLHVAEALTLPWPLQCLVVTGSSADSFRDPDWNQQLKARLAAAVKRQQRILGLCYGHQIMARVLGGETGRPLGSTYALALMHSAQRI